VEHGVLVPAVLTDDVAVKLGGGNVERLGRGAR
jgi:hypothetical protein